MDTFQVGIFDSLDINQCILTPEPNFGDLVIERVDADVDLLSWGSVVDLQV